MELPLPPSDDRLNVAKLVKEPTFTAALEDANIMLAMKQGDHDALLVQIAEYEQSFIERLGDDYEGNNCIIEGVVSVTDENDVVTGDKVSVHTDDANFLSVTANTVDGSLQIVFMFQGVESINPTTGDVIPGGIWYAKPGDLTTFELFTEDPLTLLDAIHAFSSDIYDEVSTVEFLALPWEVQRRQLEQKARGFYDLLAHNLDEDERELEVESPRFIVRFKDMPLPLEDCITSQMDTDLSQWIKPRGEFVNVVFPELEGRTEPIRTIKDFPYSHGVPCLVLVDATTGAEFTIAADDIGSMVFGESLDFDEAQ